MSGIREDEPKKLADDVIEWDDDFSDEPDVIINNVWLDYEEDEDEVM